MMPRCLCGVAAAALCALFAGCTDSVAPLEPSPAAQQPTATPEPYAVTLRYTPCGFALPEGQDSVSCGRLEVPEDRANPQGRSIELAVAVFHATGPAEQPDPLVYLAGGPGGSALAADLLAFTAEYAAPVQEKRDIVFLDQRGVGQSTPALDCGEFDRATELELSGGGVGEEDGFTRVLGACHDRLVSEGIALAAYTSAQGARDVQDLMRELRYEQWNLYGVSYGTRLALTSLRDVPQGIRSVVLDSAVPLQTNLYADSPAIFASTLAALSDACDADPDCGAAYGDTDATFYATVRELNANPATVPVYDEFADETYEIEVDGDVLVSMINSAFSSPDLLGALPSAIAAISAGDTAPLSYFASFSTFRSYGFSLGAYFSVTCAEEVPFHTADAIADATSGVPAEVAGSPGELARSLADTCATWETVALPAIENAPVASDVPALVLAGRFDPITPPSYGRMAAETLARSHFFEFPAAGHGVLDANCPMEMVAAFLDDPTSPPDLGCHSEGSIEFLVQ